MARPIRLITPAMFLSALLAFLLAIVAGIPRDGGSDVACGDAQKLISLARSRLGMPYAYGGHDWETGMDCSGFTEQLFKKIGIDIPWTAYAQYQAGTKISREQARPGDLIYWGNGAGGMYEHVALYIGNNTMIHAGNPIKEVPVIEFLHGTGPQFFRLVDFTASGSTCTGGGNGSSANTPEGAKSFARGMMGEYGWNDETQWQCLVQLWEHESGWRYDADNPVSDAYGIPQAITSLHNLPEDYMTNGESQIKWGFGYIQGRYGTPCKAWEHWQNPPNKDEWGNWY